MQCHVQMAAGSVKPLPRHRQPQAGVSTVLQVGRNGLTCAAGDPGARPTFEAAHHKRGLRIGVSPDGLRTRERIRSTHECTIPPRKDSCPDPAAEQHDLHRIGGLDADPPRLPRLPAFIPPECPGEHIAEETIECAGGACEFLLHPALDFRGGELRTVCGFLDQAGVDFKFHLCPLRVLEHLHVGEKHLKPKAVPRLGSGQKTFDQGVDVLNRQIRLRLALAHGDKQIGEFVVSRAAFGEPRKGLLQPLDRLLGLKEYHAGVTNSLSDKPESGCILPLQLRESL